MATCVPVRDMKSTAEFTALVEREQDVTVTRNGYSVLHCISDHQYRLMQDEVAKAKLLSRILLAEQEAQSGLYEDFDDFIQKIRSDYGL